MNTIEITTRLDYDVGQPTSFALSIMAAQTAQQFVVEEHVMFDQAVEFRLDPYGGGTHQLVRLDVPEGPLGIIYRATVELVPLPLDPSTLDEIEFRHIPGDVLPYLNPSRYCESDELLDFAGRHFASVWPGHGRVQAVANWVGSNVLYESGVTNSSSSAVDTLLQRAGVCRDFAHVAIALCRALGIPARYVSGYGLGVEPQDFHGFFEAYLGHEWVLFDPTGMAEPHGLVRIGVGRDAADVAFATYVGVAQLVNKIVTVELADQSTATRWPPSTWSPPPG